jgi:hypothetical protein
VRVRRVLGFLLMTALVCVVFLGLLVAAVMVSNPRDQAAYLHYVKEHGNYDGKRVKVVADREDLVAAGDRACDWLRWREPALWRGDGGHNLTAQQTAFLKKASTKDRTLPKAVVPGAWKHLCPGTRILIEPHRPWEGGD